MTTAFRQSTSPCGVDLTARRKQGDDWLEGSILMSFARWYRPLESKPKERQSAATSPQMIKTSGLSLSNTGSWISGTRSLSVLMSACMSEVKAIFNLKSRNRSPFTVDRSPKRRSSRLSGNIWLLVSGSWSFGTRD